MLSAGSLSTTCLDRTAVQTQLCLGAPETSRSLGGLASHCTLPRICGSRPRAGRRSNAYLLR
eukprot:2952733-Pyramimonas_sp.AAC.1